MAEAQQQHDAAPPAAAVEAHTAAAAAAIDDPKQQPAAGAAAGDDDQQEAGGSDGEGAAAPLSKRQQKRQAKLERQQATKRVRRDEKREAKAQELETKREAINTMLAGLSEAERQEWYAKQKDRRQQLAAQRAAAKARDQQALSAPQKVVIDLNFPGLMSPGELRSLCQQLSYAYSAAVHVHGSAGRSAQLHLHLLGVGSELQAVLDRQLPGHVHWAATRSELSYREFFKDRVSDLVYLTADSPHELDSFDPTKVYVLGGLVDRNRHKGICYMRALDNGVATARLPIGQHVKLATSAVITVNQVVDIISRLQDAPGDWRGVLGAVLPGRKRVDQEGGSGSKEGSPQAAAAAGAGQQAQLKQEASDAAVKQEDKEA